MMNLIAKFNQALAGLPDRALSILLAAVSLFGLAVAIFGQPLLKAAVAAWFIIP